MYNEWNRIAYSLGKINEKLGNESSGEGKNLSDIQRIESELADMAAGNLPVEVDPEIVTNAVDDWLDDHPEATTTVQDGAITDAKLDANLQATVADVGNLKTARHYQCATVYIGSANKY